MGEAGEIWFVRKARGQRSSRTVEARHGRNAERQLDSPHERVVVVHLAYDASPARVRRDYLGDRSMAVYMIQSHLGVVFDYQDEGLFPEPGFRDCFHDSAQGEIV